MSPGTIYPGLMVTSATLYNMMQFLNITIDIRNVCVFLAPFFSSLTTIVTYLLTKELKVSIFLLFFKCYALEFRSVMYMCLQTSKFTYTSHLHQLRSHILFRVGIEPMACCTAVYYTATARSHILFSYKAIVWIRPNNYFPTCL